MIEKHSLIRPKHRVAGDYSTFYSRFALLLLYFVIFIVIYFLIQRILHWFSAQSDRSANTVFIEVHQNASSRKLW